MAGYSELLPLPEWENHHWERPRGAACPNCACCTATVCENAEWRKYPWPAEMLDDLGSPPICPCQEAEQDRLRTEGIG